jgi:hypothetical protein
MFDLSDIRVTVGWLMVILGAAVAAALYFPTSAADAGLTHLSAADRQRVPFEIFKYALITVGLGAVSLLWKVHVEKAAKERDRVARDEDLTRQFRDEIIEIYSGFKAVRREIRARSDYRAAAPVRILREDLFELYSLFNAWQHRLEAVEWRLYMAQPFLGTDQEEVHVLVRLAERYLGGVGRDARQFDKLNPDEVVTIDPGGPLHSFVQPNRYDDESPLNEVNALFFDPMWRLRTLLHRRVHRLASGGGTDRDYYYTRLRERVEDSRRRIRDRAAERNFSIDGKAP